MSEWKEYYLNDVYSISSGLSKPAEDFGSGFPFLSFKEVFNNFFIPEKLSELVESTEKERLQCSIKRGDVFLTRTSETVKELGMSCVALKDYENATFNGFTKRLRPKENVEIIPEYAGYYFRNSKFRQEVTAMSSASTRASLNIEMIGRLKIILPSKVEQTSIAFILKNLDAKIENLRRQNETLEQIAQTLFKHWFIDFEFPNADGKPYKSSGGAMSPSELGDIPEGWRVGKLGEIIVNYDKKRIPLSSTERQEKQGKYPYYGAASIMDYIDDYIFDGLYILMGEDGTVIDEKGYPILQYVFGKFWANNHAHVLQGKDCYSTNFVYLFLKRTKINNVVTGAVQPKINQANMNRISLVIPNVEAINYFELIINPIFKKKIINIDQIQTLTKTRDTLLPKLMSGQLRVKE